MAIIGSVLVGSFLGFTICALLTNSAMMSRDEENQVLRDMITELQDKIVELSKKK